MKMVCTWFLLSCKRYLKKPGILLALLLLPVTAWLAGSYVPAKAENEGIKIALYLQKAPQDNKEEESSAKKEKTGEDNAEANNTEAKENLEENWEKMGDQLIEELLQTFPGKTKISLSSAKTSESLFYFYLCDSEEELQNQVISGKAECGYVIPEDLGKRLKDKKIKNAMTLYTSPSTVTGSLSSETVFASLAKLYDRQLLMDYIQDESAGELYDSWYANGNIFHFKYVYGESKESGELKKEAGSAKNTRTSVFPVKGITAVIIFTMSLYSACILEEDEKKGLFVTLHPAEKYSCQAAAFLALPVLSLLSGLLALTAGGILKGEISQIAGQMSELLLYGAACCIYAGLLKCLLKNGKVLFCLIPFFIMGSLIFTPVFVDIGRFVPCIQWIGRMFLPYYYLY